MRSLSMVIGVLLGLAGTASGQPEAEKTMVPDRDTILRLGAAKKGFEILRSGKNVDLRVADPLPDGRVPVVVLVLVPADRKRHGWEQEIDLLEKKIVLLEAEKAEAYGEHEYQLAKMIDEARIDMQNIRDRVGASGKPVDLVEFKAVELGILLLKKRKGEWRLAEALKLGIYGPKELGAHPADADLEVRVRDFNLNGFGELKLTTFIELFHPQAVGSVARSHSYHYLVEFFPQGARTTFQIDGGIDSGGMCEGPLDGMTTAKLWVKSPKRGPAEISVSRNRSMCERGQDPLKDKPAFERLAWSDKYRRWQVFKGHRPDSFLIVAASDSDKKRLERKLRQLKRRRIHRRFRLGKAYPRMVMSDDFRGLKTGSYLLVLGACPDAGKAKTVLRQIRKKYRGRGLGYSVRGYIRKKGTNLHGVCPRAR